MSENILINFPTNIGDAIMGLPVLDRFRARYPEGKITAIASPRTKDFFLRNNFIDEVIIFDKSWKISQKARFALSLGGKYDVVVDLKNSFLPVIIRGKKRTPFYRVSLKNIHSKDTYLKIVSKLIKSDDLRAVKSDFNLTNEEKAKWDELNLPPSLFIACSSLSALKRYPYEYLKEVIERLLRENYPLVILGEKQDKDFYKDILSLKKIVDLVGKTTISDVFYLLKNYARFLLCVDSSILHLGSYLNLPIVALFGPTNIVKFGPWSEKSMVVKNNLLKCSRCEGAACKFNYQCMKIDPQQIIGAVAKLW